MGGETVERVVAVLERRGVTRLDLTGGAPELNPHFRDLVRRARALGVHVIDRCNLTILEEPEQRGLAPFLAGERVEVVASLPCYLEENVDGQRGKGVYRGSLAGLRRLNDEGYGMAGSGLALNLVYNPTGPFLPPAQEALEADYKARLGEQGIHFNRLYTITNMPIQRFGSALLSKGGFDDYLALLKRNHREENRAQVMCRSLISVDWRGELYDCDFNQMLALALSDGRRPRLTLDHLLEHDPAGWPIAVADHCYGCTAGAGSSCGGALE
ncbi:arsenosugar biosynthesis radical SAM protein ArsS [Endothiovibrio diazotrophicus]